jgi:glutathione gamma-glutamylcysteinyltransferase
MATDPAVTKTPLQGTFHRRALPEPAVSFASKEGKEIFAETLQSGYLNGYFHLAEHYSTQGHPSFCGIGSLTMALNALLIDPGRVGFRFAVIIIR